MPTINQELHLKVKNGELEEVKKLLSNKDADVMWLDPQKDNQSLLHVAAASGNKEMVNYLLEQGALIDCQSKKGNTPLFSAIRANKLDVAVLLLDMNADPNLGRFRPIIYACGYFGGMADQGKPILTELIEKLIEKKADINTVCIKTGSTPLSLLIGTMSVYLHFGGVNLQRIKKMIRFLIEKGASIFLDDKLIFNNHVFPTDLRFHENMRDMMPLLLPPGHVFLTSREIIPSLSSPMGTMFQLDANQIQQPKKLSEEATNIVDSSSSERLSS